MTARDRGIEVVQILLRNAIYDEEAGLVLDAIPDDLLVDLLVERGVIESVTLPHGNHTISVYQRKDT